MKAFGIAIAIIVSVPLLLIAFRTGGTVFKRLTDGQFVDYILENRGQRVDITRFFGATPKLDDVLKALSASYFECESFQQDRYLCRRNDTEFFDRGYFVMIFPDDQGRVLRMEAHTEVAGI